MNVEIPTGLTQYQTTVAYQNSDGTRLSVDVSLDFNVQTGQLTATFTSLDPLTGQAPTGVFDGFLYPENGTGVGEGYVQYTVKPTSTLTTGTTVSAQASVVFDVNAPLATDSTLNTIDSGPPTSSVAALPSTETSTAFTVSWSGTDDTGGSGIADSSVFVSTNGGAFVPFLTDTTDTTATFFGQSGDTYAFYSVATDNVGNVQATPTSAQTSTTVTGTQILSPTVSAPTSASVAENGSATFTDISIGDVAAGTPADQLTLSVSHGSVMLESMTGLSIVAGTNGGPLLTVSGTVSALNAALTAGLVYTPTTGFSSVDSLSISLENPNDSLSGTGGTSLTVGGGNQSPTVSAPSGGVTVISTTPFDFTGGNAISVADPSGTAEQLTLMVSHGTLNLGTTTRLTVSAGTGTLTLTGTLTNLNNDLPTLTYTATAGATSDTLSLSDKDTADSLTGTGSVSITIDEPPTVSAPTGGVTVISTTAFDFSGGNAISVADPSGTAEQLTLMVSHGTLSLGTTTGLTVSGGGTATLTLTGTLSNLNNDLPTLSYTATAGATSDTLSLSDKDTADGLTGTKSVSMMIDEPPTVSAPTGGVTVISTTAFDFTGGNTISVTDPSGTAEQLILMVSHGTLNLGTTTGLTVSGAETGTLTLTATLSSLNNDLPTLTYTAAAGATSDTLSLSDKDTADALTGTNSVPITVSQLSVTAPASASVNENASLTFSKSNGNAITLTDAAASGLSDTLTFTATHGVVNLGSTTGITVMSGKNGTASLTVKGTLANLNSALSGLKFTPTSGFSGLASLTVTLNDTVKNQSASAVVSVAVDPIVSAPAMAKVNENASLTFSSANQNAITLTDGAASGSSDSLTLTVTQGILTLGSTTGLSFSAGSNNTASMTVNGTLANLNSALKGLKFTPATGYFGTASLSVVLTDADDHLNGSASVSIAVNAPASTPTVKVKTPLTTAVRGEPVPLVIEVSDTNATAQAAPFEIAVSFGDGHSTAFSSKSPVIVNHIYISTGTITVTVTATDEYGHVSKAATVAIKVVAVAVETNPFNKNQTALFVGTAGSSTVSFAESGKSGIAVTINGTNEGVYTTTGPVIVFTQGALDTVTEGSGLSNVLDVATNPTADNIESDLDNEALQWAGLSAAMDILNA